jgi:hypothetical protein
MTGEIRQHLGLEARLVRPNPADHRGVGHPEASARPEAIEDPLECDVLDSAT